MLPTLFYIPSQVAGVPVFGLGLLLALWALASLVWMIWLVRRQGFNADTRGYVPLLLLIGLVIWLALPALVQYDPQTSEPLGLPIRGYGVMLLAAVSAGVWLAVHRARRAGFDPDLIYSMAFWLFVSGIVGARLFYIIEYWGQFQRESLVETLQAMANVAQGGLVVYGSVIGAGLAFVVFARRHGLLLLALSDLIAPSLALGLSLGRVGCLLNGCCFGGASDLPWAVTFPAGSPPHTQQVQRGLFYGVLFVGKPDASRAVDGTRPLVPVIGWVQPDSPAARLGLRPGDRVVRINQQPVRSLDGLYSVMLAEHGRGEQLLIVTDRGQAGIQPLRVAGNRSQPVHPTQVYSAVNALLLCLFLLAYDPFRRRDGELTALLFTIYPVTRFLLEVIRIDETAVFGTGLSISQNISLVLLVAAAGSWIYLWRQPARGLGAVRSSGEPPRR